MRCIMHIDFVWLEPYHAKFILMELSNNSL